MPIPEGRTRFGPSKPGGEDWKGQPDTVISVDAPSRSEFDALAARVEALEDKLHDYETAEAERRGW